jgi:hypothetical protein
MQVRAGRELRSGLVPELEGRRPRRPIRVRPGVSGRRLLLGGFGPADAGVFIYMYDHHVRKECFVRGTSSPTTASRLPSGSGCVYGVTHDSPTYAQRGYYSEPQIV